MLKFFVASLLAFGLAFSTRPFYSAAENGDILVSAAISLKNAFEEIGSMFEKETGIQVRFNLGASGLLQKQIESGAPVDVFASAGKKQMDELQAQGYIFEETRRDFARNALVLIVPSNSGLPIRSLAGLADPQVGRVAIGNPKTVPAGQYAGEALRRLNLWAGLQSRLVLAENVRQVLDYVARGEADAGLVYASDVPDANGAAVLAARVPEGTHSPILYPIAVVRGAGNRAGAQRFLDLTLSNAGQAILAQYGFLSPR
jgi:molybdate transport system substrate-binding protein